MHMRGDEDGWTKRAKGYLTVSVFRLPFTAVSAALCPMMGSRHQFVHPTLNAALCVTRPSVNTNLRLQYVRQAMTVHLSTDTEHK